MSLAGPHMVHNDNLVRPLLEDYSSIQDIEDDLSVVF